MASEARYGSAGSHGKGPEKKNLVAGGSYKGGGGSEKALLPHPTLFSIRLLGLSCRCPLLTTRQLYIIFVIRSWLSPRIPCVPTVSCMLPQHCGPLSPISGRRLAFCKTSEALFLLQQPRPREGLTPSEKQQVWERALRKEEGGE